MTPRVPFLALAAGPDSDAVRDAIARVVASNWYVLGPEVDAFETEFAATIGVGHAVGVGTGTDALALALRGLGIGPGDEVITAPVTAAYTALAVVMAGATPIFADVDPQRLTLDPDAVDAAVTSRTAAIMPVHLYGQAADMTTLEKVAARRGLAIVEDACQAHLASEAGRPVGSIGTAAAFSFYPTKNLGALGDAGAITTNDAVLAARLRRLRNGGQSRRYHHDEVGINSRLDEMQAAILRARMPFLAGWTARRRALGARYRHALAGTAVDVPPECDAGHVYHLFPVLSDRRDEVRAHMEARGIGTSIHYPVPVTRQAAFADLVPMPCPVADRVCDEVFSLPLHPQLSDSDADRVTDAVQAWRGAGDRTAP